MSKNKKNCNMGKIGPTELILLVPIVLLTFSFIPMIFYLLTLQNTLSAISQENRRMQPGQVWLTLIPVFGIIWQFIIVNSIADSLKAEFSKRNILNNEIRPGISIGLTYCILNCCGIIPFLGILTGLAGFICWIIYWSKINGFKAKLQQTMTYSNTNNYHIENPRGIWACPKCNQVNPNTTFQCQSCGHRLI